MLNIQFNFETVFKKASLTDFAHCFLLTNKIFSTIKARPLGLVRQQVRVQRRYYPVLHHDGGRTTGQETAGSRRLGRRKRIRLQGRERRETQLQRVRRKRYGIVKSSK